MTKEVSNLEDKKQLETWMNQLWSQYDSKANTPIDADYHLKTMLDYEEHTSGDFLTFKHKDLPIICCFQGEFRWGSKILTSVADLEELFWMEGKDVELGLW